MAAPAPTTPSSSYSSSSTATGGSSSASSSSTPSLRQLFHAEEEMSAHGIAQIRFGSSVTHSLIDSLQFVPTEKPQPMPGQILVRMTVRPINPSDLNTIRNSRFARLASQGRRVIIGDEGCGIVEEVGQAVTKFVKGQRVIPLGMLTYFKDGQGTWQDYIVVDEANAFPVPPSVSDEVAAQFIVNPWAAMGILERLDIPKGEYLLQTAAGSTMGSLCLLNLKNNEEELEKKCTACACAVYHNGQAIVREFCKLLPKVVHSVSKSCLAEHSLEYVFGRLSLA